MYSLIIVLIAIALVILLALATLYYGSDAFNKTDVDAQVAKAIAQGQQISGAYQLRAVDKPSAPIPLISELIPEAYLTSVPYIGNVAWRNLIDNNTLIWAPSSVSKQVCKRINLKLNKSNGIPRLPVKAWAKQCFGEGDNDKYHILWDGIGQANVEDVVAEAVNKGKDTLNAPVPPNMIIAALPSDPPGGALPDNTWVEPPLSEKDDAPAVNTGIAFSTEYDILTRKFSGTGEETFVGGSRVINGTSNVVNAELWCDGNLVSYPVISYQSGTVKFFLNHVNREVFNDEMIKCEQNVAKTQILKLRYDDGSKRNFEYTLTVKDSTDRTSRFDLIFNPATASFNQSEIKVSSQNVLSNEPLSSAVSAQFFCYQELNNELYAMDAEAIPDSEGKELTINLRTSTAGGGMGMNGQMLGCKEGLNQSYFRVKYGPSIDNGWTYSYSKPIYGTITHTPYEDLIGIHNFYDSPLTPPSMLTELYNAMVFNIPHSSLVSSFYVWESDYNSWKDDLSTVPSYLLDGNGKYIFRTNLNYGFLIDSTKFNGYNPLPYIRSSRLITYRNCNKAKMNESNTRTRQGACERYEQKFSQNVINPDPYQSFSANLSPYPPSSYKRLYWNELITLSGYNQGLDSSQELVETYLVAIIGHNGHDYVIVRRFDRKTDPITAFNWQ